MAKKKYLTGLNVVKNNFDSGELIPMQDNPNIILSDAELYQTKYNYLSINDDKDKELLFQYEFAINNSLSQINKNLKNICEKLFLAQKLLANYDNTQGAFLSWFTSFGIDKNFVYRCIDRYKVYLETQKDIYLTDKISIRGIQLVKNLPDIETKVEIAEKFERNEFANSSQIFNFLSNKFDLYVGKAVTEQIVTEKYSIEKKKGYLNIRINGVFSIGDMKKISALLDQI